MEGNGSLLGLYNPLIGVFRVARFQLCHFSKNFKLFGDCQWKRQGPGQPARKRHLWSQKENDLSRVTACHSAGEDWMEFPGKPFSWFSSKPGSTQSLCLLIDLSDTERWKGASQGYFTGLSVSINKFPSQTLSPPNHRRQVKMEDQKRQSVQQ